ncbi:MAG: hypothetical protein LBH35_06480 [Treponema sp.]|jgi:hypothetical protein|nr:hypothetical protein [Treponema sp.]
MKIPAEKISVDPRAGGKEPLVRFNAGKTPPAGTDPAAGRAAPLRAAPEPTGADRLRGLLSTLKLPNDSLSESLVSFSRYFSLPLESSSLGALRREALVQKRREAAALGAAAAADKGLGLESQALEEYAAAIDPAEWREEQGREQPGREQQERQRPGQPEQGEQQSPNGNGDRGSADEKPAAEDVRRRVTALLEKGPIPDFINRIPGKNGRRWIVLPFSLSGNGFDLRASFRISLPDTGSSGPERFAADIAVFRKKKLSRRWFFLLEGNHGGDYRIKKAEFSVSPPFSGAAKLIRELAETFTLPQDAISPCKKGIFTDLKADLLQMVDEEV